MKHAKTLAAALIGAAILGLAPGALAQMGGGMMGGSSDAPRTDPTPFYNAGMAAYEAHNYSEAIRQFRSAHRAEPGNSTFNYALGLAYAGAGQEPDAQRAYANAIRDHNAPADAWVQLGLAALRSGDRAKSAEQQSALQQLIASCDARCGEARRGELQTAYNQLSQALNAAPASTP